MDDAPPPDGTLPANLRFLKGLVTVLTVTMIGGVLAIVALLVIRLSGDTPPSGTIALPEAITLPEGARATAFTQGTDWYAVVTGDDRILIYDRATGALRQTVRIER